jgi:hypothetical protein
VPQQCPRIGVVEPAIDNSGSPRDAVAGAVSHRADERDPLREQAAGDEAEDLRGRLVEPLRIVDETDERLLLGDLREQRQRREPDEEPVRRGAGINPNTVSSASRCGTGNPSRRSLMPAQS